MKAVTGLSGMFSAIHFAASSSAVPPISPIMSTESVSGSSLKSASASMKSVPLMGSPPMPMAVVWPMPAAVSWNVASYVSVPERLMTPTCPFLWI